VDDGIATGSSMLAAIDALRTLHPKNIVVAVPVASFHADQEMNRAADDFVSVLRPESFFAIGEFYGNFAQMEDSEVQALLERAAHSLAGARPPTKKGVAGKAQIQTNPARRCVSPSKAPSCTVTCA